MSVTASSASAATPAASSAGWQVTARHRSSAAVRPAEPFGTWHARRPGEPYTACGLPAAVWPIFWHLSLSSARERACPECQSLTYVSTRR